LPTCLLACGRRPKSCSGRTDRARIFRRSTPSFDDLTNSCRFSCESSARPPTIASRKRSLACCSSDAQSWYVLRSHIGLVGNWVDEICCRLTDAWDHMGPPNAHHHPPGAPLAKSQTLCIGSGACCCWATLYALRILASLKLLAVISFSDNQGSRTKLYRLQ
jgi:hypothetical protein